MSWGANVGKEQARRLPEEQEERDDEGRAEERRREG